MYRTGIVPVILPAKDLAVHAENTYISLSQRRAAHIRHRAVLQIGGHSVPADADGKFRRLRQINGDTEDLAWLQLEKRTNQRIPDELFRWFKKERISAKDILFIADRMSPIQIRNYLQKQKPYFDGSCRQALTTWQAIPT